MAAVFAYGMTGAAVSARSGQTAPKMRVHSHPVLRGALPADTRFVPAPHLDFLAAHRIGQVGLYLGGKVSKRLPGLRVGFRAGAPKPERGKLPACRAFLHRHTQAPFDLALQTDTPPADNTVRFRTGACADARGKRGLPRRVEEWAHAPAPGKPLLVVAMEPIP